MKIKIAPSILSANFARLQEDVDSVSNADMLHYDMMDGHFVESVSFGPLVVREIKTLLERWAHLMVEKPEGMLRELDKDNVDGVIIHKEIFMGSGGALPLLKSITGKGLRAGIALNPATNVNLLSKEELEIAHMILIMSVNPGRAGQEFINVSGKIRELRKRYRGMIGVDGGINPETAKICVDAGADVLVSGSFIFRNKEMPPGEAVEKLRLKTTT